mgnify:CR=1 FL=1
MSDKYLSAIVVGRNDDYGSGFMKRFQRTLDILSHTVGKAGFSDDFELIITEWNPPRKMPPLKDALKWPSNLDIRIVEVPRDVHKSVRTQKTKLDSISSDTIGFFEFIAKNTAIRRAKGEFIVCSNSDIIFNQQLIDFFAQKKLSKDHIYRIDRDDLEINVLRKKKMSFDDQLKRFPDNVRAAMVEANEKRHVMRLHSKASGDFLLMAKEKFEKMRGYPEFKVDGAAIDRFGLHCAGVYSEQILLRPPLQIFHQKHVSRHAMYKDSQLRNSKKQHTFFRAEVKEWFKKAIEHMETNKVNLNPNMRDWGLASFDINEYPVGKGNGKAIPSIVTMPIAKDWVDSPVVALGVNLRKPRLDTKRNIL